MHLGLGCSGSYEAVSSPGLGDGDRLRDEECLKMGGRPGENSIEVRCWLLLRAAEEGLDGGGFCFYADEDELDCEACCGYMGGASESKIREWILSEAPINYEYFKLFKFN
jgi:hypothetical protein